MLWRMRDEQKQIPCTSSPTIQSIQEVSVLLNIWHFSVSFSETCSIGLHCHIRGTWIRPFCMYRKFMKSHQENDASGGCVIDKMRVSGRRDLELMFALQWTEDSWVLSNFSVVKMTPVYLIKTVKTETLGRVFFYCSHCVWFCTSNFLA